MFVGGKWQEDCITIEQSRETTAPCAGARLPKHVLGGSFWLRAQCLLGMALWQHILLDSNHELATILGSRPVHKPLAGQAISMQGMHMIDATQGAR